MGRKAPRFCSPRCQNRNWVDENRSRARKLWRDAYARNREKKLAYAKQYQKDNPEKVKLTSKKCHERWDQTERGKRKNSEKVKRYKARKLGAEGTHTHEQFLGVVFSFGYRCLKCGNTFSAKELTKDHIIPLTRGGSNYISNIQPLYHPCNSGKRDKIADYRLYNKRVSGFW